MGFRRPYTIFPRKLPSGRTVYYYQTRDSQGRRTTARSTGEASKKRAAAYCEGLRDEGRLMPLPNTPVGVYLRRFIPWEESPHTRARQLRGKIGRSDHPARVDQRIRDYMLPWFDDVRWSELSPAAIEEWYSWLKSKGLASATIYQTAAVLKTIVRWAYRKDRIIHANPFDMVDPLPVGNTKRGILTLEEARALFTGDALNEVWEGNELNYTASLLAMHSAMRMGEILAVTDETFQETYIHVDGSWSKFAKRHATKTGEIGDVPVPAIVSGLLRRLRSQLEIHPGYLFSHNGGRTPCNQQTPTEALYRALKRIGIDETKRQERNITFHSWRHFANTYLRGAGVPDAVVRSITRHSTVEMTEHYTHFEDDPAYYRSIVEAQKKLLG